MYRIDDSRRWLIVLVLKYPDHFVNCESCFMVGCRNVWRDEDSAMDACAT